MQAELINDERDLDTVLHYRASVSTEIKLLKELILDPTINVDDLINSLEYANNLHRTLERKIDVLLEKIGYSLKDLKL